MTKNKHMEIFILSGISPQNQIPNILKIVCCEIKPRPDYLDEEAKYFNQIPKRNLDYTIKPEASISYRQKNKCNKNLSAKFYVIKEVIKVKLSHEYLKPKILIAGVCRFS